VFLLFWSGVSRRRSRETAGADRRLFFPPFLSYWEVRRLHPFQGASLLPSFAGSETPTAVSYAETLYPKINMGWAELRAIRTNHWKYVRAPKPELYDLSQDPAETTNVIQAHTAERERFEAQLKAVVGGDGAERSGPLRSTSTRSISCERSAMSPGPRYAHLVSLGRAPTRKTASAFWKLIALAEDPAAHTPDSRRIELLQQAVKEDPGDPDLYYQLGAKYEKGRAARRGHSVVIVRRSEKVSRTPAAFAHRRSDVASWQERRTIPEYEKAASMNPADTASQTNLAVAYLEMGRLPDAERVFHWVITTDPQSAAAFNG